MSWTECGRCLLHTSVPAHKYVHPRTRSLSGSNMPMHAFAEQAKYIHVRSKNHRSDYDTGGPGLAKVCPPVVACMA